MYRWNVKVKNFKGYTSNQLEVTHFALIKFRRFSARKLQQVNKEKQLSQFKLHSELIYKYERTLA